MDGLATIFAENGGLIGLIILALFVLVAYLIRQQSVITSDLIEAVRQSDERVAQSDKRLVDFKKAMYEAGNLPERRKGFRGDDYDLQ